jgi:FixJ family two-component response regulator
MSLEAARPLSSAVQTVYVVDDDDSMRRSLCRLLEAAGFPVVEFASATEFLDSNTMNAAGCVLLDLSMPGFSGLELQEILVRTGRSLPVVFLTGRGDVPSSVRAMKSGAVDFLIKPVPKAQLIAVIRTAFARDQAARTLRAEQVEMRRRLSRLTRRESEVVKLVARGLLNKQIASELGTVEKTVKVHRSRALTKLEICSVADLVRLLERAAVPASSGEVEELQTA